MKQENTIAIWGLRTVFLFLFINGIIPQMILTSDSFISDATTRGYLRWDGPTKRWVWGERSLAIIPTAYISVNTLFIENL